MDEILNLIESVSEGFPSYFYVYFCTCEKIKCVVSVYANEMKIILLESLFIIVIKTYLT